MKTLGYYNGTYDEIHKMTIPMNDRVCWFGDGVYDAGPCRNYNIFALDEHVDRFFNFYSSRFMVDESVLKNGSALSAQIAADYLGGNEWPKD